MRYRRRPSAPIHNVVGNFLTDGLKRLEYPGLRFVGIAVNTDGKVKRYAVSAAMQLMEDAAHRKGVFRTHRHRPYPLGDPRRENRTQRPPLISGGMIAVVHNGIAENFDRTQVLLKIT